MQRELDLQRTPILCCVGRVDIVIDRRGGGNDSLPVGLLSMRNIHRGLTRPARHSTQHVSISLTPGSSCASIGDGSCTDPGASRGARTSPRFATASGDPFLIKSIAPMPTATAAAAARASALRINSGFEVYERVAPLGRVIVRIHRFPGRKIDLEGGNHGKAEHLLCFPSSSMIS
jgi:hypothetical protein